MNKTHFTRQRFGFTIMELIIVVVIIGVLAAVALPSYRFQMLKMKNQEAVRALTAVWEAQKDYYRTNDVYTAVMGDLDVEFPSGLKYFSGPNAVAGTPGSCGGPATPVLATAVSLTEGYTLSALDDGRVVCSPCGDARCTKMGFSGW